MIQNNGKYCVLLEKCWRSFWRTGTAWKMKFSIKDFFSICDQIRNFLRIWSHLLKKLSMENFIFCAVWKFLVKRDNYFEMGDFPFYLVLVSRSTSVCVVLLINRNNYSMIGNTTKWSILFWTSKLSSKNSWSYVFGNTESN